MKVELHILQNFAPANLNRSDTGSPKDCEFGGYRRARVSSQCFKRAMRDAFKQQHLLGDGEAHMAVRTKRLMGEIADRLKSDTRPIEEAQRVVEAALNGVKLTIKDGVKTQYLLFLGNDEINRLAGLCADNYDALLATVKPAEATEGDEAKPKKSAKAAKNEAKAAIPLDLQKAFLTALDGGKAADLALFGRMLADLPDRNVDAASQVAHALSTNAVSMEFDFYTAVDDLKPDDNSGADMLGTIEFNSACFYRYLNVDTRLLQHNLQGDTELTAKTIEAFIRAAVHAIPTGKQNSMAAQQKPSFVMVVARKNGLCSLANAFVKPIKPNRDGDLVENSIVALSKHYTDLAEMYGEADVVDKALISLSATNLGELKDARVRGLDALIERVRGVVADNASLGV